MKLFLLVVMFSGYLCTTQAGVINNRLEGNLIQLKDGNITQVPGGSLSNKTVFAFFYSAHWCPPCRQFTPSLAATYTELLKKYPHFELVFASSDRSKKDMHEYMAWGKMNYPALDFDVVTAFDFVQKNSARGIPYLVVLDSDGNELAGKGTTDWVHPNEVIPKLKKILAKTQSATPASPASSASPANSETQPTTASPTKAFIRQPAY